MKRLHVSFGVADLDKSIAFYTSLFGEAPSVVRPGYAKSEKSWTADPDGVAWEAFHTHRQMEEFGSGPDLAKLERGDEPRPAAPRGVCCS